MSIRTLALAAVASVSMAAPVLAATIREGHPGTGSLVALDPADFTATGPCGYGASVINDGCSVALKDDRAAPHAFGRFDPWGNSWIDSQDLAEVTWTIGLDRPFQRIVFALTDAYDQGMSGLLGQSFFRLTVGDAVWSIDQRESDATLHWLTVDFDAPTTTASLQFSTRLNDGWGIGAATVAPVPLPAPALLLLAGLAGLVGLGRRRTATTA